MTSPSAPPSRPPVQGRGAASSSRPPGADSTVAHSPGDRDAARHERIARLLDAARTGDRDSLDVIVVELTPLVWHTARAAGLDHHTAEDITQTVWIRLLRHLDTIENPAALTAWLVVVTRHEAWRVARTVRRDRHLDERAAAARPDPGPGPERLAELSDQSRRLWAAVGGLTAECQVLLRLAAFAPGTPLAVVSDAVGRPPSSIGPTRLRCMRKLREILGRDPVGGWR